MKPWKVLFGVALVCVFILELIVAGLIYGAVKRRNNERQATAAMARFELPERIEREQPAFFEPQPILGATNVVFAKEPSETTKTPPGDDLFKDLVIPRLRINLPRASSAALKENSRQYVRCDIEEGDRVYTNVAIRLKGGPGSYRELHDHPSFTINFDEFTPGQKFHGLKKIHLNSSVQDRSFLEEKISRELFNAAGVPTPRAGHVVLTINNRKMGVYVLIEGINKQFLKQHYKDPTGDVYDGHSGNEVTMRMEVNSGDNPDPRRLRPLAQAARMTDLEERAAALERTLDVDRFLSYVAMETILWHWDGYTMHRNNFRIFHDQTTDRMVFFPQGMDQMLQKPRGPIFPDVIGGLVARSVLEVPEFRKRYVQRVAELTERVLQPDAIATRLNEISARLQEVLAENDGNAAENQRAARSLARRFQDRHEFLGSQLNPPAQLRFDEAGVVQLTGWKPRQDAGEAVLRGMKDERGKTVLSVAAKTNSTAGWRTSVMLEPGKYEFTGRIKTRGVALDPADRRAGAGLRIGGHRDGQKNSGDNDWMDAKFEFEVAELAKSIDLICDLRADKGEMWVDLESLKLRKLP